MAQQKKGMSSRRLAVNSIAAVSSEILGMIALLWVNQFLLRRIGAEEYALVPVVTSLMFFGEFLRTIFTSGLARFMVEEDTRGNDAGVTRIASSMIPVLGLVALFFGLLGALAVWKIDRVITVDPANIGSARLMLGLMVATFCLSIATMPLSAGLYVKMRFVEHYLVDLSMEMLRIALLLGLLFGIGPEARWVTVALCISGITGIVIWLVYTRAILPSARFEASAVSLDCVKTLLSFSMWTSVQSFTQFVQSAAPALLLNRHGTAIDVSSFYLGNLPNLQIQKLVQVVAVASTAELTALYATKGEAALRPLYYTGGRYFLWGSLFLVPPLVAFSEQLITLYVGGEFLQAALVMVVVFAIYPFSFASSMYHRIAYAVGRIRAYNMYSVLLSLAALAFIYVFVVEVGEGGGRCSVWIGIRLHSGSGHGNLADGSAHGSWQFSGIYSSDAGPRSVAVYCQPAYRPDLCQSGRDRQLVAVHRRLPGLRRCLCARVVWRLP